MVKSKSWIGGAGIAGALAVLIAAGCGGFRQAAATRRRKRDGAASGRIPARAGLLRRARAALGPAGRARAGPGRRREAGDGRPQRPRRRQRAEGRARHATTTAAKRDRRRASAQALEGIEVAGALGGICATAARAAARDAGHRPAVPGHLGQRAERSSAPSARPTAYLTNGTPYQSALAAVHFLAFQRAQRLSRGHRGRPRVQVPGRSGAGPGGAGPRSRSASRRCRPGRPTGTRT